MKLVFVHGAGEGKWIWEHQLSYFKDSIAISLPGHDDEEDLGINSVEEYAEWVISKIDAMNLKEVVLVGHSMGGAITMVITLKKPSWLKAIILIATGAKLKVAEIILEGLKSSLEDAFKVLSLFNFGFKQGSMILNKYRSNFLKTPLRVSLRDFMACDKFDYRNEISKIEYPTLIICGDKDFLTPLRYHEFLKENIKNSRLVVIKDAGHMVMLEKPEEVNEEISKFLKEIELIKA